MNPTTYNVRYRLCSGEERVGVFDSMLARTLFVIGFEGNGFGTIDEEWT